MIDGVVVKQLKVIPDERGFLMEMLRVDDPFFQQFGQATYGRLPGRGQGLALPQASRPTTSCACTAWPRSSSTTAARTRRRTGEVNEFFMGETQPDPGGHPAGRPARHEGDRHRGRAARQHRRPIPTTTRSPTSSASTRTTTTSPTTGTARTADRRAAHGVPAHPRHGRRRLHRLELRAPGRRAQPDVRDHGARRAHLRRQPGEPRATWSTRGACASSRATSATRRRCARRSMGVADVVFNFAAETHVDRSIEDPAVHARPTSRGRTTCSNVARELRSRASCRSRPTRCTGESIGDDLRPRNRRSCRATPTPRARPAATCCACAYAQHVRAAARHHALLEQLRSRTSTPRSSSRSSSPTRWKARPAALRRRHEPARLDPRRGPLRAIALVAEKGRGRARSTTSPPTTRAQRPRRGADPPARGEDDVAHRVHRGPEGARSHVQARRGQGARPGWKPQ